MSTATLDPRLERMTEDERALYLIERARMMVAAGFWIQGPHAKARPGVLDGADPDDPQGLIHVSPDEPLFESARYVGGCAMGSVRRAAFLSGLPVQDHGRSAVEMAVQAVTDHGRARYDQGCLGTHMKPCDYREPENYWNDRKGRTREDVLAVYDDAITDLRGRREAVPA